MKKKIAVIGFGGMGSWHVNHAQKSDVLELAGIYDIDPQKGEKAKDLGVKVIWALGLPGKVAPVTSGNIIKETILNIFSELGE